MNYATIKPWDIANGPGVRVSLFVSGCTHHCKDCFNPEAWDFDYGEPFTEAVMDHILELLRPDYIRGITYLGGEPFDPHNQPGLLALTQKIRAAYPEKSIWSFTGYVYGQNLPQLPGVTDALLALQNTVGKIELSKVQTLSGDMNGDGKISVDDALVILQMTVGK